eukprot:360184-Chlamydomonas_euryale.AAC.1
MGPGLRPRWPRGQEQVVHLLAECLRTFRGQLMDDQWTFGGRLIDVWWTLGGRCKDIWWALQGRLPDVWWTFCGRLVGVEQAVCVCGRGGVAGLVWSLAIWSCALKV